LASVRSVENAGGVAIPANARLLRNLLMGAQYVHDHVVQFYHLHALDWVDAASALTADPTATAALAATVSPAPPAIDYAAARQQLTDLVDGGQSGLLAGGWWGHPAYLLSPEENLLYAAHYLFALRQQLKAAKMHAIFGGKNPHVQSLGVGGLTCRQELTAANITAFRSLLTDMRGFVDNVYLPDVVYLARKYPAWAALGGFGNYLAFGEFPQDASEPSSFLLPRGLVMNRDLLAPQTPDVARISEHVSRSFYSGAAAHPASGQTTPAFSGYDTASRYSWLKAPRYNGEPFEVGPLARMLTAYAGGNAAVVSAMDGLLAATGLSAAQMHSTIGRAAARALETKLVADQMDGWLNQLAAGGVTMAASIAVPWVSQGAGLNEAPRGALGHWIGINNGVIENYQMVVPTTWNLGPRCDGGKPGPLESALVGVPVADTARPLEVLRVVHSFDPCIACAVHLIDRRSGRESTVRAV
jgi:[NiFe] hydrogenase large subunit